MYSVFSHEIKDFRTNEAATIKSFIFTYQRLWMCQLFEKHDCCVITSNLERLLLLMQKSRIKFFEFSEVYLGQNNQNKSNLVRSKLCR